MTGTVAGDAGLSTGSLTVKMMDGNGPPPLKPGKQYPMSVGQINPDDYLYHPRTHRHLFFAANISSWDDENKVLRTVPFPNGAVYAYTGDGKPYTWMPHVSRFVINYPLSKLKKLPPGAETPSPYK